MAIINYYKINDKNIYHLILHKTHAAKKNQHIKNAQQQHSVKSTLITNTVAHAGVMGNGRTERDTCDGDTRPVLMGLQILAQHVRPVAILLRHFLLGRLLLVEATLQ